MLTGDDTRPAVDSGGVLCANCEVKILPERSYPPLPWNIVRSNQIPSKAEMSRILDAMQEEEKELQSYDKEIERLLHTVNRLKADREQLHRTVEMRRSCSAPIRKLPAEIMGRIFDLVIIMSNYSLSIEKAGHDSDQDEASTGLRITAIALTLSHVSFRWRNIALSQRSIWSRISMGLVEGMSRDLSPLLQLYLDNAAGHPLRVKIKNGTEMVHDSSRLSVEEVRSHLGRGGLRLFQMLTRYFPSCEVLALDFLHPKVFLYTMTTPTSFPLLHTLICNTSEPISSWHEVGGSPAIPQFWNAVREAPLLRDVRLNETGQSRHQEYIPWRRLTSLSVDRIDSYADFRFAISRTHQLEVLRIGQGYQSISEHNTTPPALDEIRPIYLPRLWKVDLFNSVPQSAHYTLASLNAPFIRDLRVCIDNIDSGESECWDFGSLYSMIGRSTCRLTRLSLSVLPFGIWGESFTLLVKVLKFLPLLEYLELRTAQTSGPVEEPSADNETQPFLCSIFSLLAVTSSSSRVLLPRLEDLRVTEQLSASVQTITTVLDIVEERSVTGLATIGRTDVTPLTNVLIGIRPSSSCWRKAKDRQPIPNRPVAALEKRMAALEMDGTKCSVITYFRK
ncbi:hypothetical protein VNI00_004647 [Paramarasmius palmivorus]|uniref:F-box domain-containing protein n=1 Tax=Paramarasmius palmivorus TaxID=297713 RepID=A0AAW0DJG4_9AGAR